MSTTVPAAVKIIEVLGPGCPRCFATYRTVCHVVEEAGLECRVVKVESLDRMTEVGVLRTPAIAFDERLVLSGQVPDTAAVKRLLGLA